MGAIPYEVKAKCPKSPHQHPLKFPKEDEFPLRFLLNSLQAPSDMGFSGRARVALLDVEDERGHVPAVSY